MSGPRNESGGVPAGRLCRSAPTHRPSSSPYKPLKKGDTLYLTEAPDGGYRLTPYDPEFARQMALAK